MATLAALLAALGAAPALAAAPRPDNPNGARISLSAKSFAPGATVSFTGTGWSTEADVSTGAVVGGVKLDDTAQLNAESFTADAAGNLSGSVTLPASVVPGEHWLRFLSGSDQPGDPARSLHVSFRVVAAPPSDSGAGASTSVGTSAAAASTASAPGSTSASAVAAGTGRDGAGTLPKTGMNISTTVWLSGGLLAVATLLAGAAHLRRRRRTLEQ